MSISSKGLRKAALVRHTKGHETKADIFKDMLSSDIRERKLARMIANIPDDKSVKLFRPWSIGLGVLMVFMTIFFTFGIFAITILMRINPRAVDAGLEPASNGQINLAAVFNTVEYLLWVILIGCFLISIISAVLVFRRRSGHSYTAMAVLPLLMTPILLVSEATKIAIPALGPIEPVRFMLEIGINFAVSYAFIHARNNIFSKMTLFGYAKKTKAGDFDFRTAWQIKSDRQS